MRETVPSPAFDTHAEPNPHSTSYGELPTRTLAVTRPVRASIRVAVDVRFATAHTAPGARARLNSRAPTEIRFVTFPVDGSMRRTSPIARPPAQTLPPSLASPYVHSPTSAFIVEPPASRASAATARSFTARVSRLPLQEATPDLKLRSASPAAGSRRARPPRAAPPGPRGS